MGRAPQLGETLTLRKAIDQHGGHVPARSRPGNGPDYAHRPPSNPRPTQSTIATQSPAVYHILMTARPTITELDIDLPDIDAPPPKPKQWTRTDWLIHLNYDHVLIWVTRGSCWYCGCSFSGSHTAGDGCTIDHLIPHSRGGSLANYNCAPACRNCNSLKGTRTPREFQQYIMKKYKLEKLPQFWGIRVGLTLPLTKHYNPNDWRI